MPSSMTQLEANLSALARHHANLAIRIRKGFRKNGLGFMNSRSGLAVPVLDSKTFHSRFDPVEEGRRYLSRLKESGFIVFLGLGAGYHIRPFLERKGFFCFLIVENDVDLIRTVFENVDMRWLFEDPRVRLSVRHVPSKQDILDLYIPHIAGGLDTVVLPGRVAADRLFFEGVADKVRGALEDYSRDIAVQIRFGKTWFLNIVGNLQKTENNPKFPKSKRKVIIAGAGPSLERHSAELKAEHKTGYLVSTDTALPYLMAEKIIPDVVLSIDCQHISYLHFLSGLPARSRLALDLASPTALSRLTDRILFTSSGHPMCRYINRFWKTFPVLDTSAGNVTQAAFSLAQLFEPEIILFYGVDFAYSGGRLYTKCTYMDSHFRLRNCRLFPLESQTMQFLFGEKGLEKFKSEGVIRYTTEKMRYYRDRLESIIADSGAELSSTPAAGLRVALKPLNGLHSEKPFSPPGSWRDFLERYRRAVKSLPAPTEPLSLYWWSMTPSQREIWLTMLPAAAALGQWKDREKGCLNLTETQAWTLTVLARHLK